MFVLDVLSAVGVPLLLSGQSYKICLRGCVYIHINKYIHLHLYFFMLLSVPLLTTHGFFPLPFLYNSVVSQTNGNQIFSVVYLFHLTHVPLFNLCLIATLLTLLMNTFLTWLPLWHSLLDCHHSCLLLTQFFLLPYKNILVPACCSPWNLLDAAAYLVKYNRRAFGMNC